jgi:chemotaxis regulatin CheY-phosphate phosphatase CheZ
VSASNTGLASIEQVVTNAIRDRVERIDPVRKAARATQRAEKKVEASRPQSDNNEANAKRFFPTEQSAIPVFGRKFITL